MLLAVNYWQRIVRDSGVSEMKRIEEYYRKCSKELSKIEGRLTQIEKRLQELPTETILIKKVKGKPYYYRQFREEGKTKSKSLGAVKPGSAAVEERQIVERRQLLEERKELLVLRDTFRKAEKALKKEIDKMPILEDYSFEVYWKDELTAKVRVKGKDVYVSSYSDQPGKRLFPAGKISRFQLNEILKTRCWDEGRPDINELLRVRGIQEYNPLEIVRKTHGVSWNDFIWLRFPGEQLTAKDVLVR